MSLGGIASLAVFALLGVGQAAHEVGFRDAAWQPEWLRRRFRGGEGRMAQEFPQCLRCNTGVLLPLSDYGREGASIRYKAWVCSNPDCGFNLRIDNGEISIGRNITESYK